MHEARRDYFIAILVCSVLFFTLTSIRFYFAGGKTKRARQLNEILRDLAMAFAPLAIVILSWEFLLRDARRAENEQVLGNLFREQFASVRDFDQSGLARIHAKSSPGELRDFIQTAQHTVRILVPWFLEPTELKPMLERMAGTKGMSIQIILLRPDSLYLKRRGEVIQPTQPNYGTAEASRSLFALRDAFGHKSKASVEVFVYDSLPSAFIVVADNRALLGWFMNTGTALDTPILECEMRRDNRPTLLGSTIDAELAKVLTIAEAVDLSTLQISTNGNIQFSAPLERERKRG
jgi:hypothetical protein